MYNPFPSPLIRFAAFFLDTFFLYGLAFFCMWLGSLTGSESVENGLAGISFITFGIFQLVLLTKTGQTLGKKICRIRIVRWEDGELLGFFRVVLARRLIFIFTATYIVPFVNVLIMIVGSHRRAIHDFLAGSVVVHASEERIPLELAERKRNIGEVLLSTCIGILPFILLSVGVVFYARMRVNAPDETYNDALFTTTHSARFSLDTTGSDDETSVVMFEKETYWVQLEVSEFLEPVTVNEETVFENFQTGMQVTMDSVIGKGILNGYGIYDAKGKRFRVIKDGTAMNANVYVITEQNHFACITELYALVSSSTAERDFDIVEKSFRLCSNYEEIPFETEKTLNTSLVIEQE